MDNYTHLDTSDVTPGIDGKAVLERAKARGEAIRQKKGLVSSPSEIKPPPGVEVKQAIETGPVEDKKARLFSKQIVFNEKTVIPRLELIAGLFPRGYLSFVASAPGIGKSWLVEKLASDLSFGGTILDGLVLNEPPRRVLFFCGESRWTEFGRRADKMRWDITSINLVVFDHFTFESDKIDIGLDADEGRKNIEMILDAKRPDIVIFDSLFDFHDLDENKAFAMKPVTRFLNEMANKYLVAIVVTHHNAKRQAMARKLPLTQDDLIGTSLFSRNAAMIYSLEERTIKDAFGATIEGATLVRCQKSWTKKPKPFAFKIEDLPDNYYTTLRVILNPKLDTGTKVERVIEGVSELFEVGEPFTRNDLEENFDDIGERTIERALKELKKQKIIEFRDIAKGKREYWRKE